jgi:hypothetical protein
VSKAFRLMAPKTYWRRTAAGSARALREPRTAAWIRPAVRHSCRASAEATAPSVEAAALSVRMTGGSCTGDATYTSRSRSFELTASTTMTMATVTSSTVEAAG